MEVKSMTTGEIIQNKRKQFGWSQDQLAEKLNISRQSISKWEQDLALPDLENGVKLCETLGITVEELLHLTNNNQAMNTVPENSFQSAEKFFKKSWHYFGIYLAVGGSIFVSFGYLFKFISTASFDQFMNIGGGSFEMFQPNLFENFFGPIIGVIIGLGVVLIIVGLSIFFYGRYRKQHSLKA